MTLYTPADAPRPNDSEAYVGILQTKILGHTSCSLSHCAARVWGGGLGSLTNKQAVCYQSAFANTIMFANVGSTSIAFANIAFDGPRKKKTGIGGLARSVPAQKT